MSVRNSVPSHLRTAPCRMCKTATAALVKGVIQMHPVCPSCQKELDRQFRLANLQRAKSAARR